MLQYLRVRPHTSFILPNGFPMTKYWFKTNLASVLTFCGLSPHSYIGYSFHIGAATTAAESGIPDATIRMLSRWSSKAYEIYLRSDPRTILVAQQTLSSYNQGTISSLATGGGFPLNLYNVSLFFIARFIVANFIMLPLVSLKHVSSSISFYCLSRLSLAAYHSA